MKKLDRIDQELIDLLSENSRTPVAVLAKKMKVARTTINNRINRLERENVIERYTLKLGSDSHLRWLIATVLVHIDQEKIAIVSTNLKKIPQVSKIITLSGRSDIMLTLRVESTIVLDVVLDDICQLPGVIRSETFIQLNTKFDRANC
ncbi:MAG: Lrp/AsnC family transcriptional regulator [Oceanospirillaceae bacterium]